jgi:hypothetical protein
LNKLLCAKGVTLQDKDLLIEFCNYDSKFKSIEKQSETTRQVNSEYLCVRLDGIGLSNKYLKNSISNKKFDGAMWQALEKTYEVLHRKAPTDAQNIFLAVVICSDEISIILNNQKNYFEGRLYKTVTTLASTFSSFFTRNGLKTTKKDETQIVGAFDGRPLVFDNLSDVTNYMAYRYAIYLRNTSSKLLRLNNVPSSELYSSANNNNIDYYSTKIEELNLKEEFDEMAKKPIVFIPTEANGLSNYRFESLHQFIESVPNEVISFDNWLKLKCA